MIGRQSRRELGPNLGLDNNIGVSERTQVSVLGDTRVPNFMRNVMNRPDFAMLARMKNEVQAIKQLFETNEKRPMRPSEQLYLHQEMLCRAMPGVGFAPRDMMMGRVLAGPNRGKYLKGGRYEMSVLSGSKGIIAPTPKDVVYYDPKNADDARVIATLAGGGSDTHQGAAAGDLSPVESPWDTGLYGSTAATVPAPYLDWMLRKYSRGMAFLPMCYIGFAPSWTFKQRFRSNTLIEQLFEGTNLGDLKGAILPREERESANTHLRPKFDEVTYTVRGYAFDSYLTWELLTSPGEGILGIEEETLNDLFGAPALVGEYDIFQALWVGLNTGKLRRYKATTDAWDVATFEVPFGAANFITANARKHVLFVDMFEGAGKFYKPSADADYLKYGNSVAVGDLWKDEKNSVYEIITYLVTLQRKKGKKADAVWLDADMLALLTQDERTQNMWYDMRTFSLQGESGLIGYLRLPGTSDILAVFVYDDGGIPALTTGDAKVISHVVIVTELGIAVTYSPFWPLTLLVDREYEAKAIDGKTVTRPTMNDVLTTLSAECVEPMDLNAVSVAKIVTEETHG